MSSNSLLKRYYYKIYDITGKYITTWHTDVLSDPQFRTVIQGGAGQLLIQLNRQYNNYGEGVDIVLQNRVEVWVGDADNLANNVLTSTLWDVAKWDVDYWDNILPSFVKIYTGYISQYTPILDGQQQYVQVTCLGYVTELSYRILTDGSGNTKITYTNQDPGVILKDIINKYQAQGNAHINYQGNSVQNTGVPVTYTFSGQTIKQCLDKLIQLCPDYWYYSIDANGIIYLQQQSIVANHQLTIGKDINYFETNKRIENMVNSAYVIGGGNPNLFNMYNRTGSITAYGLFASIIQDSKVTDNPSSDVIAKRVLDMYSTPETQIVMNIIDNNGENMNYGQNIESFIVGDTIQIKNFTYGKTGVTYWDSAIWDTSVWDATLSYTTSDILVITSIQYNPDFIQIEASSRLPEVSKSIADINTLLAVLINQNLPSAPTGRTV